MTSLEKLQTILDTHYPAHRGSVTRDTRFDQFDIDSLGIMELFFAIEDAFGISVPNDKRALHTVGDLADYVDELSVKQGVPIAAAQHGNAASAARRAGP